jgi:hypothetical protein
MNVRDPLWNAPKPDTGKNSTVNTPSQHSTTRFRREVKPCGAGAVIEALSNAKLLSFSEDQESKSSIGSLTKNSTLTQSGVDAIVSAIESQPSPHLWSFKQFWYIAATVTAITILLPLIAGSTFRATLRSFNYYKSYWRASLFVLVLAVGITLDVVMAPAVFLICFAVPQCIFAVWELGWAHVRDRHKKRWIGFATVLGVCIIIDLSLPGATQARKILNFGVNIGLTGWVPPSYLFVIWIQADPPLINPARINRVKEWFAFRINSIAGRIRRLRESKAYKAHKQLYDCFLLAAPAFINGVVSYFMPGLIYPVATGIPFGLYSLDKLLKANRPNDRYWWIAIIAVIAISEFLSYASVGTIFGLSGILPTAALWAFCYRDEIMTRLRKYFPRLFGRNPPGAGTSDPEPGIPLTVPPASHQVP